MFMKVSERDDLYSYIEGMAYVYLDHSGNKHYAGGKMHTVFKQFELQIGIISTMATVMEKIFQQCRYR